MGQDFYDDLNKKFTSKFDGWLKWWADLECATQFWCGVDALEPKQPLKGMIKVNVFVQIGLTESFNTFEKKSCIHLSSSLFKKKKNINKSAMHTIRHKTKDIALLFLSSNKWPTTTTLTTPNGPIETVLLNSNHAAS